MARALFVASTKQHIGKTSTCSGLLAGLKERFAKVGYIKPVGQRHVPVVSKEGGPLRVDKDVRLFKEFFDLDHLDYQDMSPLIVPRGYTRSFLDGKVKSEDQRKKIQECFGHITEKSDFTVIEGTGHCGVGSIIEMDNARVAAVLGVDMVLVCNAGVGSSFDELELNRLVCNKYGVRIKGVVLNRVAADKLEMVYFKKALARWGIPLVGCIPYNQYLYAPAMMDFEQLFKTSMISGEKHRFRHFAKKRLMAASLSRFANVLPTPIFSRTLWITDFSRSVHNPRGCLTTVLDLVAALLDHAVACKAKGEEWDGGLILAGSPADDATDASLVSDYRAIVRGLQDAEVPVLRIQETITEALAKVNKYVAKLNPDDQSRTSAAIELVKPCLDYDVLLS